MESRFSLQLTNLLHREQVLIQSQNGKNNVLYSMNERKILGEHIDKLMEHEARQFSLFMLEHNTKRWRAIEYKHQRERENFFISVKEKLIILKKHFFSILSTVHFNFNAELISIIE